MSFTGCLYGRANGSGRLAWSKCRRLLALFMHSLREPGEPSQYSKYGHVRIKMLNFITIFFMVVFCTIPIAILVLRITQETFDLFPPDSFKNCSLLFEYKYATERQAVLSVRRYKQSNFTERYMTH